MNILVSFPELLTGVCLSADKALTILKSQRQRIRVWFFFPFQSLKDDCISKKFKTKEHFVCIKIFKMYMLRQFIF